MFDAERILGSLVKNALSGKRGRGRRRGRRGRAGLEGSLLSGGQKGALALGALGVAIAAFEHLTKDKATESKFDGGVGQRHSPPPTSRASVPPPPPPPPPPLASKPSSPPPATPPTSPNPGPTSDEALLLVRAMIAAANADHRVDGEERRRILEALDASSLGAGERDFLLAELESPLDPASLAAQAGSPELARQVYLASLMAIQVDTPAEQEYLSRLASALELSPEQVAELDKFVGSAK